MPRSVPSSPAVTAARPSFSSLHQNPIEYTLEYPKSFPEGTGRGICRGGSKNSSTPISPRLRRDILRNLYELNSAIIPENAVWSGEKYLFSDERDGFP